MSFEQAEFITSAPALEDCPEPTLPEFCFAGRSNVGKSSLINRIVNSKRLARTSNTPGKTQQMNYYRIDGRIYLVDLPGFGYAKVPERERQRWGKNIRQYLLKRDTLALILHLVDARHKPGSLDEEFFYWMAVNEKPFSVLLTKSDKISSGKLQQSVSRIRKIHTDMNIEVPVIPCSAGAGTGIDDVRSLISEFSQIRH
ncbi:MAG: ribosome biogenesis GTP-binding protein YihA/YsxC [Balneolaceae bacterium]